MSKAATREDPLTRERQGKGTVALTQPEVHEILSNERRLRLLELLAAERTLTLSELAETIAAAETGEEPPPRNIRQSVYVSLQQTHLPKLTEVGFVEYDEGTKEVTLTSAGASVVEQHAAKSESRESKPWPLGAYLALVTAGLALSLASTAGLGPLSGLAPATYAVAALFALLVAFGFRIAQAW